MASTSTDVDEIARPAEHVENTTRHRFAGQTHHVDWSEQDVLDPHIKDDHGDPHRAALEDAGGEGKINKSTVAAVFFLGFTFQPSLSFTIYTVYPILTPIALALQNSTANVNWMASGWSLGGSVSFAIAGQLSDYFGRRYILLFGQLLLIIGHILGATAQSINQAIAAMVVLGFGTGTTFVLYPGVSELLPNKYRSYGLGYTELNLLPFSTFGPLIGRSLVQNATWRWVFGIGAITGGISLIGTTIFYFPPLKPIRDRSRWQIAKEVDYVGILLYTAALTLFLLGLGWGGISYPWKSAAVIAPMVVGICLFILTFVWDFSGIPKRPLFPKRLFLLGREYTLLLVIIFVTGLIYFSLTALIPTVFSDMFTSDQIMAGYYNIPAGFAGAGGGVFLGGMVCKIKKVHIQLVVGIAIQTLFTALFALSTPDRLAMTLVFQLIADFPFAWITLACYIVAGIHVPQREIGLALGLVGTFRFLGGSVGTTVFPTILANRAAITVPDRVNAALAPLGYPVDQIPGLIANITNDLPTTGVPQNIIDTTITAMRWGYADAYRLVWYVTIPFGVIACILAFFVIDPSPYFTSHTAVTLEKDRIGGRAIQVEDSKAIDMTASAPASAAASIREDVERGQ